MTDEEADAAQNWKGLDGAIAMVTRVKEQGSNYGECLMLADVLRDAYAGSRLRMLRSTAGLGSGGSDDDRTTCSSMGAARHYEPL